jgi:HlyD family secretion protein
MKKRRFWIGVIVILVVVGGYFGYSHLQAARAAKNTLPQTATVQRGDLQAIIGTSGTVSPSQSLDLTFGVAGTVSKVLVAVGDEVKDGQALAQLDTRDLESQVASTEISLKLAQDSLDQLKAPPTQLEIDQAKAAVATAQQAYDAAKVKDVAWQKAQLELALSKVRKTLEDAQAAYDRVSWRPEISMLPQSVALQQATEDYKEALDTYNIGMAAVSDAPIQAAAAALESAKQALADLQAGPTDEELMSAQAQVDQAQITLDNAKRSLENATLAAPFDGTITSVDIVTGQAVAQSGVVMSLADLVHLETYPNLPEVDVVNVKAGQTAELTLDAYPDNTLTGKVTQVALVGTVTQGVVNYPVTIAIDSATVPIKPGMTASISIIVDERTNVLMVPNRAVHSLGNNRGYYVDVLVEGQQIQVSVTIGLSNDSYTEIVSGEIQEGDQVVVSSTTSSTSSNFSGGFGGPGDAGGIFFGR